MVARAPGEEVHSVQLYGVDPAVMALAVRILVEETGVDHIDLNFGCPAPKVTRKGGGAALPAHPVLFARVVRAAVRAAGTVPVTVKMRKGLDDATPTAVEAALIAAEEGVAAVSLHARTAEQRYAGAADWSAIAELKDAVKAIPVLGNGDIWEAADAPEMMERTGCDGVVIGRGCLGRPWLFAALEGQVIAETLGLAIATMRRHASLLCERSGEEAGMRDFRKHTGWYLTGYPVGGEARRTLNQAATLGDLEGVLSTLDPDLVLPAEARRLPRGHTDGPKPVALPAGWLANRMDPTPPHGADVLVSGG
jgi:nifR3 family TIM-barrel protein